MYIYILHIYIQYILRQAPFGRTTSLDYQTYIKRKRYWRDINADLHAF